LSRPARPTRSSRAPHRHDFDARAFTRALYRGGRNHVGPANMLSCASRLQDPSPCHGTRPRAAFASKRQAKADSPATAPRQRHRAHRVDGVRDDAGKAQGAAALRRKAREGRVKGHGRFMHAAGYLNTCCEKLGVADAARRREPAVGQEAVSSRSRMRRLVRSQWLSPRHG